MTATATIQDLHSLFRTRSTDQLITQHALADEMIDGSGSDGAAIMLMVEAIEAILGERGIHACEGCGTINGTHAEYCR